METNVLLMAKLIVLVLFWKNVTILMGDPFLPFFGVLDSFRGTPVMGAVRGLFIAAGIALIFNRYPRACCLCLGSIVILANVNSKIVFSNHFLIAGCLLFLAGLHKKDEEPVFIRWQIVILYLGAFVNKLFEIDWLNGRYFENWMFARIEHPQYIWAASFFPDGMLSLIMGWFSIVTELAIMFMLMRKKTFVFGIWLAMLFHFGMFLVMKGYTFEFFIEMLCFSFLAFMKWPNEIQDIKIAENGFGKTLRAIVSVFDLDKQFRLQSLDPNPNGLIAVNLDSPKTTLTGASAARHILMYSTGFYIFGYAIFFLLHEILPYPFSAVLSAGYLLLLLILFFPYRNFTATSNAVLR